MLGQLCATDVLEIDLDTAILEDLLKPHAHKERISSGHRRI